MCKYSENHSPDSFDNVKTALFFFTQHALQRLHCHKHSFFVAELLQRPPLMLLAIKEKMQGFKETGIYDINKIGLFGKSVQHAFRPQPPQR